MLYQFTVVFEAENFKDAVNKIPEGFEVINSNARPQPAQPTGFIQGSSIPRSTGQPGVPVIQG